MRNKFSEQTEELSLDIPEEMLDFVLVLIHSARIGKYPPNNWLQPNGMGCDTRSMYASIFRHVSEAYCGLTVDRDSGLDPRLHAAARLLMDYTRDKRGLK